MVDKEKQKHPDKDKIKSGEIYCYGCKRIVPASESSKHGVWCGRAEVIGG